MSTGAITGYIDVAQLVLYAFWLFFAGLIIYLRREDKREGYPLDSERSGNIRHVGFPNLPAAKTFTLPHGGGKRLAPRGPEKAYDLAAVPTAPWPGAPIHPTGNPMVDGIGPAAYAIRPQTPDLTDDGRPKIVPLRADDHYSVAARDPDPRGKPVFGADGVQAGTITDIWVDRSEPQIRYLEMDADGRQVLIPMNFVNLRRNGQQVRVSAILGKHFADVPALANPEQITLQEEDQICAYYGGGTLYATPERSEPLI